MTKKEKREQEASLPIEERNYWHLKGSEKKYWLDHRGLNKTHDVLVPIIAPIAGLVITIFGLIWLILTLNSTSAGIFGADNKPYNIAAAIIAMVIGLGVGIWLLYLENIKPSKGFLINKYEPESKDAGQRTREKIEEENKDSLDASNSDMELEF